MNVFVMTTRVYFLAVLVLLVVNATGQAPSANAGLVKADPLFDDTEPLEMSIRFSIKEIKKTKADSTYQNHKIHYRMADGSYDSIVVKMRSRGNFRFRTCYYPPIFIKIPKSHAKGTIFEGNKTMKLVLPCLNKQGSEEIVREFICYKLYEIISPRSFHTRLANVEFNEIRGKKTIKTPLKAILIESIDKVAARYKAVRKDDFNLHPHLLQDTSAMRFYLFQYLIANTDWSTIYQHNTKLIYRAPKTYISVPYDFDMSGVVDAPYAVVSQIGDNELEIDNVTQRLYRGFCLNAGVTEFVRNEIIAKKEALLAIPDKYASELSKNEAKKIKKYLAEFFEDIEDNGSFREKITGKCRP